MAMFDLYMIDLNSDRHMNDFSPGFTFSFEFLLYIDVKMGRYFLRRRSFYYTKYLSSLHWLALYVGTRGRRWSFNSISTLYAKLSKTPFFLNFSSANLAKDSINLNLTSPLSGTREFPFQSAPDIELVVMKVRSVIFKGVSLLMILDCWQN
jgi:hypothetical protein